MSLQSKILFAAILLPCAGLCVWAALAFGGPAASMMWIFAAIAAGVVGIVAMIPRPRPGASVPFRVEGAAEPTFRLVRADIRGQVWQLVLGRDAFTLVRPDETVATHLPRAWALLAIRRPGFVRGEWLGVAKESWSPPEDERWITAEALVHGVRTVRRFDDAGDVPYYWFEAPPELVGEIDRYLGQTPAEAGPAAAAPLRVRAKQALAGGLIGLVVGGGLLALGLSTPARPQPQQPGRTDPRVKTIALGGLISLVALARIGQGLLAHRRAGRLG